MASGDWDFLIWAAVSLGSCLVGVGSCVGAGLTAGGSLVIWSVVADCVASFMGRLTMTITGYWSGLGGGPYGRGPLCYSPALACLLILFQLLQHIEASLSEDAEESQVPGGCTSGASGDHFKSCTF